jgi:precorrin-6B methylase 2
VHNSFPVPRGPFDATDPDLNDKPGETGIRDQEVGAAAEYEQRQILLFCPVDGFENGLFVRGIYKIARGTTDAEGCQGSQGDVLVDECFHRGFSLTLRPMRRLRAIVVIVLAFIITAQAQTARRQPAPVMGVAGAEWLTRPERIREEDPDRMLASLEIKPGSFVADIGAGVGYHTWRLAEIVGPAGRVIAEDIQEGMIGRLRKNITDRKLNNVDIVLGTPTDPKLPANSIDLVLMVDVYHEFSDPVTMMNRIRSALKADGRVVLVEFRKEDPRVPIQPLHKMSVEDVRSELEPLGFRFQRTLEFLPWQHILFFSAGK